MEPITMLVLSAIWVGAASGTGFVLAVIAKRIHPGLSLKKLWLFYTVLMAFLVAIVFLIGWF
ncbi:MAG: hypothetical protein HKO65_14600 [Gemmatimonadetes bacterium]|nr:hypothetical protein [Gemmatimonadota bacterium]